MNTVPQHSTGVAWTVEATLGGAVLELPKPTKVAGTTFLYSGREAAPKTSSAISTQSTVTLQPHAQSDRKSSPSAWVDFALLPPHHCHSHSCHCVYSGLLPGDM